MLLLSGIGSALCVESTREVISSTGLGLLFFMIGCWLARLGRTNDINFVVRLFWLAYVVRAISVFVVFGMLLHDYGEPFAGGDERLYDLLATHLAEDPGYPYIPDKDPAYYYLVSWFYSAFGHNVLVPRLFNALASALTVVVLYRVAAGWFGAAVGATAAYLLLFFPDHLYYGSLQLRDVLVVLLYLTAVMVGLGARDVSRQALFAIAGLTLLLAPLRLLLALTIALVTVAQLVLRRRWLTTVLMSGVFLVGLPVANPSLLDSDDHLSVAPQFVPYFEKRGDLIERVSEEAGTEAAMESLALRIYGSNPLNDIEGILWLPVGFAAFWFLPFPPWKLVSMETLAVNLLFLGTVYWYMLAPFAIVGIVECFRRRGTGSSSLVPLTLILLVSGGLVLTGTIIGGTNRYRLMIVPLVFALTAFGFRFQREYRRLLPLLYTGPFALAMLTYFLLKAG